MLLRHDFNSNASPGVKSAVRTVYGTPLQKLLAAGSYSLTSWALVGHGLQTGEFAFTRTTPRQTVAVLPILTMALLRTMRRATPLEIAALKNGRYTVEALHEEQLANRRRPTAADVDDFIALAGANMVFDGLDRLTRPNKEPVSNGYAAANDNDGGNGGVAMPAQLSF